MATKNQSPATQEPEQNMAPELLDIDELRKRHKIGRAVFAGVCAAQEWRPGKQVSESAFLQAVSLFVKTPMDRKSEGK